MKKIHFLVFFFALFNFFLLGLIISNNFKLKSDGQDILAEKDYKKAPESKPAKPEVKYQDALNLIDSSKIKNNLEYLTSPELEGRMSGKNGNVIAAEFIKEEFEACGLITRYHKFGITRMNNGPKNEAGYNFTQNVYGMLEGSDPQFKEEIVIVGAHMDHIGYGPKMSRTPYQQKIHPGADDNASGTAVLIELAKAFSKLTTKPKRTIVFQAYSAEEMGLLGSRFYCDNPLYPLNNPRIDKHIFMLNMDMVGRLGKGQFFSGFNEAESSYDITQIINKVSQKYQFGKSITSRGTGGSDHASFYNKKVPIAFLHTGSHPDYHTPNDTADRINYDGLQQIAKYVFELITEIADMEKTPTFNVDNFTPMDYNHDHGIMPFSDK